MTDTEILGKIKTIVDDYIISYENGWLCGGDDNKTGFKAYFFEKILDVFTNIPWERKPRTNANGIDSAFFTCDYCKHNTGLPHNNGTMEYSGACKNCIAKDKWEQKGGVTNE